MSVRLLRVTAWLLVAAAILAGLYWALLSTPESNVTMLATSLLLIVLLVAVAGLTLDVAMRLWTNRQPRPDRASGWILPAVRLLPALAVFAMIASLALWAGARVEMARGSITAVLMARTGWADPEILFTAVWWIVAIAAWVVAPMMALALFGALTRHGWTGATTGWLGRALGWRALLTGIVVFVVLRLLWPPMASWRPAGLPATWVQLAFLAVKLGVGAAIAAVGVALVIRQAAVAPQAAVGPQPPVSPQPVVVPSAS